MGYDEEYSLVERAQLEMANFSRYPEFAGNVSTIDTRSFNQLIEESPRDQGYHWNRNAKSYSLIGASIAEEMLQLISSK